MSIRSILFNISTKTKRHCNPNCFSDCSSVLTPTHLYQPKFPVFYTRRWWNADYRKKGWGPWRRKLWRHRRQINKRHRHMKPKILKIETRTNGSEKTSLQWKFSVTQLKMSVRNLEQVEHLIKNKHIQDAIDWMCAIPRARLNPIYEMLINARNRLATECGADPSRLYIRSIRIEKGTPVKYTRRAPLGRWFVASSWRNRFIVSIYQMTLEDYFDLLYVNGRVPRSLSADMRIALNEKTAPRYMLEEWQPYLSSLSRKAHRRQLGWRYRTRTLDYAAIRDEWIAKYQYNILERENDLRRQRGLKPYEAVDDSA